MTDYERLALTELAKYPNNSIEWHWWRAFLLGLEAGTTSNSSVDWIKALFELSKK